MFIYKNYFELTDKKVLKKQNIVYLLSFENGKCYVGQTICKLYTRLNGHLIDSKRNKSNIKICNAILFYKKCKVDILCNCNSLEELNVRETEHIMKYNSVNNGYNSNYGGDNKRLLNETKRKIGIKNKGRKVTKEARFKMHLAQSGKILDDEHKIKIGLATSKKVINIDTGRTFLSCKEASLFYNSNGKSLGVCINKKIRHKGYKFCYMDEIHDNFKPKQKRKIINIHTKQIYDSIKEASESIGAIYCNLTFALSNKTRCKGHYWEYVD